MNIKPSSSFVRASHWALYFLAALASVLLVSLISPLHIHLNLNFFYLSHTILETGSILIAIMVFVVGWFRLEEQKTVRSTVLTSAFLGLGLMEMAHLATFDGTFAQAISNAEAISNNFKFGALSFAALGLLGYAFLPKHMVNRSRANIVRGLFALGSVVIIILILQSTGAPSATFVDDVGPSTAQKRFEIGIGLLYVIAGLTLFRRSMHSQNYPMLTIATAALTLAMSLILFSNYYHENDLNSVMGHLFKLAAYILFFRALVLKNIEQPFYEIRDLKQRFESMLDALPDLVFEISREGCIHDYHSNPNINSLLASPQQFIGHNMGEFLPTEAMRVCLTALQESSETGKSYGHQYSLILPDGEHHFEISAAVLNNSKADDRFLMIVRDITMRQSLTKRLEALLILSEQSEALNEHEIAQLGLDTLERLTSSKVSFLHLLHQDEVQIELFAWGSETEALYCTADQELHYPVDKAGIWADCVKTREPVIVNDYATAPNRKGLPEGHSELERFLSVPIFEGDRIGMIIGVGNSDFMYNENSVNTVELFGSELFQILQRRRAQNESEKNRLLLTSALENLPVGVAITKLGEPLQFEYYNQQFPELYGIDPSLMTSFESFWNAAIEDPTLRQQMYERMGEDYIKSDSGRVRWERVPIRKNGEIQRYLTIQTTAVADTNLSVTLVEDVTETMLKEEEIRIAATAFSSQEGILITDADLKILRVNDAFERSSGYGAAELIGKTPAFLQSGQQDTDFYKSMWEHINQNGVWRGEIKNKSKNGDITPFSLTISAVKNSLGIITHFVADYIDLSDIKTAQETISRLSYFDTLTGLPNREHLKSLLTEKRSNSNTTDDFIGALMIDLDNFKTINETLGHEYGDLLLLQVAQRLQTNLRLGDQIARYGGDEFVVLLAHLGNSAEPASLKAQLIAQSIINTLEGTYVIEGKSYFSTASIGATLYRAGSPDPQNVFKQLDIALSSAKSDGNNQIRFFDPAWQETVSKRARLLEELRQAITQHQLELHYQPQLNGQNEIIGAEALIRWNHPSRGLLPPSEFLPIAQESHLMIKIGDEVLRMGLEQLHAWQTQSEFRLLQLSLNITADQFYEERFEKNLLALLAQYAITPGSLMLEFTESMLLGGVEEAKDKIVRLNEAEIEFAIDDFGTGYSSLSYLSTLPMDLLKIDQSFVRNIGVVETDAQIVSAIIEMAHTLKLGVIAEGVETQEQLEYLKAEGCELFQGYLFSKPLPIDAFNQLFIATRKSSKLDE